MIKRKLLIMIIPLLFACNSPANKVKTDSHTAETISEKEKVTPDRLITPGKGIGYLTIGLPVDSATARLGRPDSSDAAMGSALMTWYSKDAARYRTAIFVRRNMGIEEVSRIKMILVTSPWFKTADGITTGFSLADIEKNYKLKLVDNAPAQQKGLLVFDDVNKGITFDIDNASKKCVSITVHASRDSSATYINMH